MPNKTRRSVGRPKAAVSPQARERLLRTAAELFAAQGFEGTSLKQVAAGAQLTPALVSYYFQSKQGLLEAVVLDGLDHILQAVQEAARQQREDEVFVARFLRSYLDVISAHPWIPQIIVREVISRDTPLRELVRQRFLARAAQVVPPRVAEDIARGHLRADLDPVHTLLSILGMCLFPFIAEPLLGPMLGYRIDPQFGERYAEHAIQMVLFGAGARS